MRRDCCGRCPCRDEPDESALADEAQAHLEKDVGLVDQSHRAPGPRELERLGELALEFGGVVAQRARRDRQERTLEMLGDRFGAQRLAGPGAAVELLRSVAAWRPLAHDDDRAGALVGDDIADHQTLAVRARVLGLDERTQQVF